MLFFVDAHCALYFCSDMMYGVVDDDEEEEEEEEAEGNDENNDDADPLDFCENAESDIHTTFSWFKTISSI